MCGILMSCCPETVTDGMCHSAMPKPSVTLLVTHTLLHALLRQPPLPKLSTVVDELTFFHAQVPKDAWSMDMVFSDSGDLQGAFYDNNSGVDYHVPVSGSSTSPPRLRIAHVSVEMAPIAKVLAWPCCCDDAPLRLPRSLLHQQCLTCVPCRYVGCNWLQ